MRIAIVYIVLLCMPLAALPQAMDNNLTYRNINDDHYFRINYENDFFTATDRYYTQGIYIELVTPALKKFLLSAILVHPHADEIRYGLSIEHNAYTPSGISSDAILYGDRPFAAALFLNSFLIATDSARQDRFSSSVSVGVLGPWAGGKEMQEGIHRWLHDIHPHGWQYQVANDAILNYEVEHEWNLVSLRNNFALNTYGMARLGTLSDKAAAGITIMAGSFTSPFMMQEHNGKLHAYVYYHPEVDAIGYDATMQGGLFTHHEDPYTIPAKDIERITFQNHFGAVLTFRRLYLEYYQSFITKEFSTGRGHHTGGVQVAFWL